MDNTHTGITNSVFRNQCTILNNTSVLRDNLPKLFLDSINFRTNNTAEQKPIDSHRFKKVLLELFSLKLCLFCSARTSRNSAEFFFSQINVKCVVKIQQE